MATPRAPLSSSCPFATLHGVLRRLLCTSPARLVPLRHAAVAATDCRALAFHVVLLTCTLLLTACDPLSFLDDPNAAKPKTQPPRGRAWRCRVILAPDQFIFTAERRIITVQLADVTVPGSLAPHALTTLFHRTASSAEHLAICGQRAHALVTSLLKDKDVTLDPDPFTAHGCATARVVLYGGIDVAQRLLREGLAMVAPNADAPAAYHDDEARAIATERGIWEPIPTDQPRFRIHANVALERVGKPRPHTDRLPYSPLHAPDLVEPPPLSFDDNPEHTDTVAMHCRASLSISATGPPKEHDLVITLQPLVKGTDLSGPLDSFELAIGPPTDHSLTLRGGETAQLELVSEPAELTRVVRAGRNVFSGYLIHGYELRVLADGELVYTNTGSFNSSLTLSELP